MWKSANGRFWLALATLAALGATLRYYDISEQIPLNDEWHSLALSSKRDVGHLFTHYLPRATAIPVNVYQRWILEVWGWSEVSTRLLSISSTLVTLVCFPWVLLRLFGSRRLALIGGTLFTFSPFWIYYGQNARPYAPYFLFLLGAYYFLHRGLVSGARKAWLCFALTGALAVYFHLYALPSLAASAAITLILLGIEFRADRGGPHFKRMLSGVLFGFGLWTLLVVGLFASPLRNGLERNLPGSKNKPVLHTGFWNHWAELLTGSAYSWLAWVLVTAALVGLVLGARRHWLILSIFALGVAAGTAVTLIVQPNWFDVALVMLRYNITTYLLYFAGLAFLLERALVRLRRPWQATRLPRAWLTTGFFAALIAFILLTSRTPHLQAIQPCNFRQHSAFAEFYSDWDESRVRTSDFFGTVDTRTVADIPAFYTSLDTRQCTIIEYPLLIHDHENPLYFYQYHHGCKVIAGFSRNDAVGRRLNLSETEQRLRFRSLINVEDRRALDARHWDYLILHRDIRAEFAAQSRFPTAQETGRVSAELTKMLGAPVHEDRYLRVWKRRMP